MLIRMTASAPLIRGIAWKHLSQARLKMTPAIPSSQVKWARTRIWTGIFSCTVFSFIECVPIFTTLHLNSIHKLDSGTSSEPPSSPRKCSREVVIRETSKTLCDQRLNPSGPGQRPRIQIWKYPPQSISKSNSSFYSLFYISAPMALQNLLLPHWFGI